MVSFFIFFIYLFHLIGERQCFFGFIFNKNFETAIQGTLTENPIKGSQGSFILSYA